MTQASLAQLPNDLLLVLADFLPDASINALTQTTRRFLQTLEHVLYVRNVRERNSSALPWAAGVGLLSTVKKALAAGADPNSRRSWSGSNPYAANGLVDMYHSIPLDNTPYTNPLASAALLGRLDVVSTLIDAGASVNSDPQDSHDIAPLLAAIEGGHLETMKLLIRSGGIDIDHYISSRYRWNLLSIAVRKQAVEIARYLLATMKHPDAEFDLTGTPLTAAIKTRDIEMIKIILKSGRIDPDKADATGCTALMWAAGIPNTDATAVQLFLNTDGVKINAVNSSGRTAISLAAETSNTGAVDALLAMPGIDPTISDNSGKQPIEYALRNCYFPIVDRFMASESYKPDMGVLFRIACELDLTAFIKTLLNLNRDKKLASDASGNSWLHTAASFGRTEAVKLLLKRKDIDINQQSFYGATPLLCALDKRRRAVITVLLRAGADVNITSRDGRSALFYATESSSEALTEDLLQRGARVGAVTDTGDSALHQACKNGQTKVVQVLLDHGADPVLRAHDGRTPLHNACTGRWEQTVQLLLSRIPRSHAILTTGRTPLHDSCRAGHTGISKLLVEHGADPLARLDDGTTPLEYTCNGFPLIAQMLLEKGADPHQINSRGVTLLYQACRQNTPKVAALLLEHGADPNRVESGGNSPFIEACRQGSVALIRTLIKHGGDVTSARADGTTALHQICSLTGYVSQVSVVKLMIEKGADVNKRTQEGFTPLHWACRRGRDLVPLLVATGADTMAEYVDPSTSRALTPVHMACSSRMDVSDIAMLLEKTDAPIVDIWASGWTPLHEAATATDAAAVELLLKHGLNPMAVAENGRTPLHQLFTFTNLRRAHHQKAAAQIISALMATGKMDINHKDDEGLTAFELAHDAPEVLRALMTKFGATK